MAESPVLKDDDCDELADFGDSSAIKKLRHMIRRPDWYEVFKKQEEKEKLVELKTKRNHEKPVNPFVTEIEDISVLSDTECDIVTETECSIVEVPKQRQRRKNIQKSAESVCSLPKSPQRTRNQGTVSQTTQSRRGRKKRGQAAQGRRGRNGRRSQRNGSQNGDPEVVFLSDNELGMPTTQGADVHGSNNHASNTSLNDSIEIISVSSSTELDVEEFDFENREINIIFCWQNKVLKLPMKQDAQFGTILPALSSTWEVQGADIMLLYRNEIVTVDDVPRTHEMLSGSIVQCSIVKNKTSVDVTDPNVITIKLQTKNSRDKKPIAVHQMSPFQSIIEQFAKEEGVSADKVVFKFDGDTISPTDTPYSLGLEDNLCIDVTY